MMCDRCGEAIVAAGPGIPLEHSSYYRVSHGTYWERLANDGESLVCAGCAWADPRWAALFG